MNMHHSRYIPSSDPWEPNFHGVFFLKNAVPCFLYKDMQNIHLLPWTDDLPTVIHTDIDNMPLSLPRKWMLLEHENNPFLFVAPNNAINLKTNNRLACISTELRTAYTAQIRPETYLVDHSFCFDDYQISHKGDWGYLCTKGNTKLWDFMGKAYLYTDIYRWQNRIFFGTGGHGGYFYVLDLDDGSVLLSINTGGTSSIVQLDNLCFVTCKEEKRSCSKVLSIDLRDGHVQQELDIYGNTTKDSKLQLLDDQLQIVTFEYRKNKLQNAIWSTISI